MNALVKEQLKKCKVAQVPNFTDEDTEILIPMKMPEPEPQLNNHYLIQLEDYIINEPEGFTLSSNWNRGTTPKYKHYIVFVKQVMGRMYKIDGNAYNIETQEFLNNQWTGWLPRDGFHVLKSV